MTEQLDTDKTPAQEGQTDLEKQNQDLPGEQDKDKGKDKPFSPEQEQYIGSWMGRIIKRQIEESIVPLVNQVASRPSYSPQSDPSDVLKKFNEEITDGILSGDAVGSIRKVLNAIKASETQLTKSQTVQVDKAITSFSEDPLYKDIYQDVKAIAHERAGKGYPADAAADYAFTKAKLNYMERKSAPGDEGGFDLTDGGRQTRTTKTPKLPPEFKKAAARDIAKGLFANEADYIKSLSPAVRAKYDI